MTAQDPVADYAAWTTPESSFTVVYSIPLFHEIDVAVNDGYRRIPHGGLEVGGILFGRAEASSVQIEAYRPIECEHSMGPSFVLSPRDIERLQEQLETAGRDEELAGLAPLGWFISHSRGELVVSDREAILFDQLFPRPEQITVLIKPVKFQPTRFAFLLRQAGRLKRDGTQQAIILPLPGRAARASLADPAPSIAAPASQPEEPVAPPVLRETAAMPVVIEAEKPVPAAVPPVAVEPEPARLSAPQIPASETKPQAKTSAAMPHALLTANAPLRRSTDLHAPGKRSRNRGVSVLVSGFILAVAASLGFGVGYLAYSRLSFSPISLTVEDHPPVLFVSWPPDESRDADSAAIRVNDGAPRPLTFEEKAGGQAEVKMSGTTVKVELLTHSWFHDARGIVRYVRPAAPTPPHSTEPAANTPAAPVAANPGSDTP